jgi:hypothetical protein
MKRFSEIQKRKVRRLNESEEANLPQNYQDMSKEELIALMSGKKESQPETKEEGKVEEESVESVESQGGDVVKFFSKLFESKEMAHIYHLTVKGETGSHAAHLALQGYYEGVIELLDSLIEVYSGQYQIIEGYEIIDTSNTKTKDKVEYFEELANFIKSGKSCFLVEDTHLHTIVDEIVVLIYKTLYKLKYNK